LWYAYNYKQTTGEMMETTSESTNTQYQQVTVDVPEDRIAEFHAFFARFLAGRTGRRARGRYGRHHHRGHGRGCGQRHGAPEQAEEATQSSDVTEV
jgi:hypothetical protein